jgi:hypothetical protein
VCIGSYLYATLLPASHPQDGPKAVNSASMCTQRLVSEDSINISSMCRPNILILTVPMM